MAFHDTQFPTTLSYGSSMWPEHNVNVFRSPSGQPHTVNRWTAPIRHWNVKYNIKTYAQLRTVYEFMLCREGATNTFRFRCPFDNDTAGTNPDEVSVVTHTDQNIGVGDSVTVDFPLTKTYSNGIQDRIRNILLPIISTVKVGVNGADQPSGWQVIITEGENTIVRFNSAPPTGHVVSWGGQFDCHARFSEEASRKLELAIDAFSTGSFANDIVIDEEPHPIQVDEEMNYGYGTSQPWSAGTTLAWSYQMGRCVALQPGAGCTFTIPSVSQYPEGGPHFYLLNDSGNTVTINSVSLASSFTLAAGKGALILAISSGGVKEWMAIKP